MKKKKEFFGALRGSTWRKEWKDMPEFNQEKQKPFTQIIVRFETKEDLEEFSKMVGSKLTKQTKSIWYPYRHHMNIKSLGWVDES